MNIYCLGDSLTEGDYGVYGKSGIANVQAENYPYFLGKLTGAKVVNHGKCGYRSSTFLKYYDSGAVKLSDADMIIIMLGTNGGLNPVEDTPDNADYRSLIERCKKDAPGARIYLCTPPHATENPAMSNCGYMPQIRRAVAFVKQLAEEYELDLIDVASCEAFTAETEAVMQPNDGLHFSAAGYEALARFIYEAIKPKLPQIFGAAQWIVPKEFAELAPIDVFHKENVKKEIELPEELKNTHMLFQHMFAWDSDNDSSAGTFGKLPVKLKITADDYYKVYINGHFVGQGPTQGYFFAYNWNEYDISEYLKPGDNEILVDVYYQGLINRAYNSGDRRLGMIAAGFAGEQYLFGTGTDWKYVISDCYTITHTIGYDTDFAENVDLRRYKEPYKPCVEKQVDYTFATEPAKTLQVYEKCPVYEEKLYTQKYTCNSEPEQENMFYDFGQEITGSLHIKALGHAGDRIRILCGEELENSDVKVRCNMRCNCLYEEYIILAEGENDYTQYEYKGFRYVTLLPDEGVQLLKVSAVVRHYPFRDDYCELQTDSKVLKAVWELCKNGVKYGSQEVYVDCPTREKGQYSGDMVVTASAQVILSGDTSLLKRAIDCQMQSTHVCKGLMAVTPGSFMQEIADYSLLFPIIALNYYHYSGDKVYLKQNLQVCEEMLNYFKGFARADGLLEDMTDKWNMVDWPENLRDDYDFPMTRPMQAGSGSHNVLNALYVGFVKKVEQIRDILELPYENHSDALTEAFNHEFYNEKTGLYTDAAKTTHSALHSNVLPLYFGISRDKDEEKLADFIMEKKLCCGVYMAYFLLKGLCRIGRHKDALALITSEEENSWYNMVREGGTTCFEAWGKDKKWNTSLCHPWASAPISVLAEDILPVMPEVGELLYRS